MLLLPSTLWVVVSPHSLPLSSKVTLSKGPSLNTQSKTGPQEPPHPFSFLLYTWLPKNNHLGGGVEGGIEAVILHPRGHLAIYGDILIVMTRGWAATGI